MPEQQPTAELSGDQIIVSQRGTQFQAAYIKLEGQPDLVLLAETMDPDADQETQFRFRADAFAAAMNKARELGWTV
jgi:hypothetical protein